MAKATTYQVVFEGGATAYVKAFSFEMNDGQVVFKGAEGEPLEDHYFRPNNIQAIIPDTSENSPTRAGFV